MNYARIDGTPDDMGRAYYDLLTSLIWMFAVEYIRLFLPPLETVIYLCTKE